MCFYRNCGKKRYVYIVFVLTFILLYGINLSQNLSHNYASKEEVYSDSTEWTGISYTPQMSTLYNQKLSEIKSAYELFAQLEDYYEINSQSLHIPNFEFGDQFLYGYESGHGDSSIYMLETEHGVVPLSSVKAFQLSSNCMDKFQIELAKGRPLVKEDMTYSNGDTMPVLVGSQYDGMLEVGDKIDGEYILKDVTFEVVGILKPNSNITLYNQAVYLDRYIIMPSFNCAAPVDLEDDTFQVRHYANKLTGKIPLSELQRLNYYLVQANQLKIGRLTVGASDPLQNAYIQMISVISVTTKAFNGLLVMAAILTCPILFYIFLKKNFDVYGVMFLSGHSISRLRRGILIYFVSVIGVDLLLVFACSKLAGLRFSIQTLLVAIGIVLLVGMISSSVTSLKSVLVWTGGGKHVTTE